MSGPVAGYCPMGCGETLAVHDGHITCTWHDCPDPLAVDTILSDRETDHVLQINDADFSVLHPLRERVGHGLLDCPVDGRLARLSGPPVRPGRYRVRDVGQPSWEWEALDQAGES